MKMFTSTKGASILVLSGTYGTSPDLFTTGSNSYGRIVNWMLCATRKVTDYTLHSWSKPQAPSATPALLGIDFCFSSVNFCLLSQGPSVESFPPQKCVFLSTNQRQSLKRFGGNGLASSDCCLSCEELSPRRLLP